jgi:hypothetical protein
LIPEWLDQDQHCRHSQQHDRQDGKEPLAMSGLSLSPNRRHFFLQLIVELVSVRFHLYTFAFSKQKSKVFGADGQ